MNSGENGSVRMTPATSRDVREHIVVVVPVGTRLEARRELFVEFYVFLYNSSGACVGTPSAAFAQEIMVTAKIASAARIPLFS